MKAITPVISVILLILITIVASASAYFFISSTTEELQGSSNLETNPMLDSSRLNLVSITGSKAIVRNDGSSPVTDMVVFVNGELLNFTLNTSIGPGEVREIDFNARQSGEDLEIKIIYNAGKSVTDVSPAKVNIPDSGFTENPLPLNQPAGPQAPSCNIEFTDTTSPVIEPISMDKYCRPCLCDAGYGWLKVEVNVSDEIPIREVLYENNGANNFSLSPVGLSGVYRGYIPVSSIVDGTHNAYAIDWLNNTASVNLGSTPIFLFSMSCCFMCNPFPGFPTINVSTYNSSSDEICLGDKFKINMTYYEGYDAPVEVLASLYYPNLSEWEIMESFYLENLDEDYALSWGGYYYPKNTLDYEIVITSKAYNFGSEFTTNIGNITIKNE